MLHKLTNSLCCFLPSFNFLGSFDMFIVLYVDAISARITWTKSVTDSQRCHSLVVQCVKCSSPRKTLKNEPKMLQLTHCRSTTTVRGLSTKVQGCFTSRIKYSSTAAKLSWLTCLWNWYLFGSIFGKVPTFPAVITLKPRTTAKGLRILNDLTAAVRPV